VRKGKNGPKRAAKLTFNETTRAKIIPSKTDANDSMWHEEQQHELQGKLESPINVARAKRRGPDSQQQSSAKLQPSLPKPAIRQIPHPVQSPVYIPGLTVDPKSSWRKKQKEQETPEKMAAPITDSSLGVLMPELKEEEGRSKIEGESLLGLPYDVLLSSDAFEADKKELAMLQAKLQGRKRKRSGKKTAAAGKSNSKNGRNMNMDGEEEGEEDQNEDGDGSDGEDEEDANDDISLWVLEGLNAGSGLYLRSDAIPSNLQQLAEEDDRPLEISTGKSKPPGTKQPPTNGVTHKRAKENEKEVSESESQSEESKKEASDVKGRYVPPHLRVAASNASDAALRRTVTALLNRLTAHNVSHVAESLQQLCETFPRMEVGRVVATAVLQCVTRMPSLLLPALGAALSLVDLTHQAVLYHLGEESTAVLHAAYALGDDTHEQEDPDQDEDGDEDKEKGPPLAALYILCALSMASCLAPEFLLSLLPLTWKREDCLRVETKPLAMDPLVWSTVAVCGQLCLKDNGEWRQRWGTIPSAWTAAHRLAQAALKKKAKTASGAAEAVVLPHSLRSTGLLSLETFKKWKKHLPTMQPLRVSQADLLDAPLKGRWYAVGAAWKGNDNDNDNDNEVGRKKKGGGSNKDGEDVHASSGPIDAVAAKIMAKYELRTPVQQQVFMIISTSTDATECCGRLQSLGLKNQADRVLVQVLLCCALAEASLNSYYLQVANGLVQQSKAHAFSLQLALWDQCQELQRHLMDWTPTKWQRRLSRLTALWSSLIMEGPLQLASLKKLLPRVMHSAAVAGGSAEALDQELVILQMLLANLLLSYPLQSVIHLLQREVTRKEFSMLAPRLAQFLAVNSQVILARFLPGEITQTEGRGRLKKVQSLLLSEDDDLYRV
jgi:hypothetical protein